MKRLWLRFLSGPAFVLLVAMALAVQSSLFNFPILHHFQPDLVLLAVIWCALRRTFTEGGILTLLFAVVAESHSAAPQGFFMICSMIVYLGMRGFSRFFVISRFSSLIMVTMGAQILYSLLQLALIAFLGEFESQWRHTLIQLLPSAGMAGLFGFWVYRGLDAFDRLMFKSERSEQLTEDELLVEEGL